MVTGLPCDHIRQKRPSVRQKRPSVRQKRPITSQERTAVRGTGPIVFIVSTLRKRGREAEAERQRGREAERQKRPTGHWDNRIYSFYIEGESARARARVPILFIVSTFSEGERER